MAAAHTETFAWTDMGWGPEYRWRYRVLSESEISSQLGLYANAALDRQTAVASVSFQPCLNDEERSQDRHVTQSWEFGGGRWSFTGVFDGHAGHETVDHAVVELPALLKRKLELALSSRDTNSRPLPELLSAVLTEAVVEYDESLLADLSAIIPGGLDGVSKLSPTEIENIINDTDRGGANIKIVHRCMRGSTALMSLVDPSGENLWVANLGDCQAVLGSKLPNGRWKATMMTCDHNGSNQDEVRRLKSDHPGEPQCFLRDRVLGAIAVTRALGDFEFKVAPYLTEDVFLLAKPGFSFRISSVYDWIGRNLTPPYILHHPDVHHRRITKGHDVFLIMCSDGLTDLFGGKSPSEILPRWAEVVGVAVERGENGALALLREGLGGRDLDKVSRIMTLESTERWMDDTTVTVQRFQ